MEKKLKKKVKKQVKKQSGGDVISASIELIKSMVGLGDSIFNEITSITNIQSDINNAASPSPGVPNQLGGPPPFNKPAI